MGAVHLTLKASGSLICLCDQLLSSPPSLLQGLN